MTPRPSPGEISGARHCSERESCLDLSVSLQGRPEDEPDLADLKQPQRWPGFADRERNTYLDLALVLLQVLLEERGGFHVRGAARSAFTTRQRQPPQWYRASSPWNVTCTSIRLAYSSIWLLYDISLGRSPSLTSPQRPLPSPHQAADGLRTNNDPMEETHLPGFGSFSRLCTLVRMAATSYVGLHRFCRMSRHSSPLT